MQEAQDRARIHLDFSAKVYRAQMRAGRYFIHEHPQSASSWKVESIEKLSESPYGQQGICEHVCLWNDLRG